LTRTGPVELILQRLGITEPSEIDLEAIAWDMGVRIRYRPLDGCEARVIGAGDQAIVTVNSRSSRWRQRFSIGHELGHWRHDRGRILFCQSQDIGRPTPVDLSPERIADRFASNLLMPNYLFDPVARSYRKLNFQIIEEIADTFRTSRTATAIRLVEGGYFAAVLVCHGPRGRRWFTRSPEVPNRWFPAADLSSESFAFSVLYSHTAENKFPRKIGADAWFECWDADRYDVQEQTILISDNKILSLILISDEGMLR
jgi:hypothetical protein